MQIIIINILLLECLDDFWVIDTKIKKILPRF